MITLDCPECSVPNCLHGFNREPTPLGERRSEGEAVISDPRDGLLTRKETTDLIQHERSVQQTDLILRWVANGTRRTDAPPVFHLGVGLVLVATAIDRNRWLAFQHKRVYPSVYVLKLSPSGNRKSTPEAYGEAAAASAFKDRLLANEYSPEGFIKDLDGRIPNHGVAFIDEAGRLFGTMRRNNYGEGLKDVLSKGWDSPERWSRKLMGQTFSMAEVYLNLSLATTPTRFFETTTQEDIASGFLARFLPMVVLEEVERRDIARLASDTETTERALVEDLKALHDRLAQVPGPVAITDEALGLLNRIERDLLAWAKREYHADLVPSNSASRNSVLASTIEAACPPVATTL